MLGKLAGGQAGEADVGVNSAGILGRAQLELRGGKVRVDRGHRLAGATLARHRHHSDCRVARQQAEKLSSAESRCAQDHSR